MEDYVHRIGRTGRAGSTGQATSFYTDRDMVFPSLSAHVASFLYPLLNKQAFILLPLGAIIQYLVAQIRKAIADVGSGNTVTFATGKVCV